MKKFSLLVLVAIFLEFGMTGCMSSQVRQEFGSIRNDNQATFNKVAELENRMETAEADIQIGREERTEFAKVTAQAITDIRGRLDTAEGAITENARRIVAVEREIPALKQRLLRDIGITKLDTGKYSGAERRWIGVGPFAPGSATAPISAIARDIQEVTKSLGKTVISGATFETTVLEVVGFFDEAPIKKSNWESNEELALERAGNMAEKIGFTETVSVSSNPKLFGEKRENNRYVYVLVKTEKFDSGGI